MSQTAQISPQAELFPAVAMTPGEIEVARRRPNLPVHEHAEKFRQVTDGPWQGKWSNEQTPYLIAPMDACARPGLRQVTVVGPTQAGKTQILYNAWLHAIDAQGVDLAMVVMGDEMVAKKVSEHRLQPIAKRSPATSRLLTGRPKDLNNREIRLSGHTTFVAWAGSEMAMEVFSIPLVILDEVDAYRGWKPGDRLSNPISRAKGRTIAYKHTGRVLAVSKTSVESGPIWQELIKSQVIMVFGAICPDCGEWQVMRADQLRWDKDLNTDPGRVQSENLAWYECSHCGAAWGELERRRAVKSGSYRPMTWDPSSWWWQPVEGGPTRRPASMGFHFSAFYSPFVPLGEIAAAAIRAENDAEAAHDLANKYLALPFKHHQAARSSDELLTLTGDLPRDVVPKDCAAITMFVDTQDHGFWYAVVAWLYGKSLDGKVLRFGYLETFDAIERILHMDFYDADGGAHRIRAALQDAMGHRTVEVYDFTRKSQCRNLIFPAQGANRRMSQLWQVSDIEFYPGTKVKIPGGVKLYRVDVNRFKDLLSGKLRIAPGDPGAIMWHSAGEQEKWQGDLKNLCAHLCVEYRDNDGTWIQPPGQRQDLWDCLVGNLALAHIMDLASWARPGEQTAQKTKTPPQKSRRKLW